MARKRHVGTGLALSAVLRPPLPADDSTSSSAPRAARRTNEDAPGSGGQMTGRDDADRYTYVTSYEATIARS